MKQIQTIEYTKRYVWPDNEYDQQSMIREIIGPHRLIMLMGLPCTGKTTVMNAFYDPDITATRWNRQSIFEMILWDGLRDEKYNASIERMEADIFPSLYEREGHKILLDGYYRVQSVRRRTLGLFPDKRVNPLCIVLDGPDEAIIRRMCNDERYAWRGEHDIREWVTHMRESMVYPSFSEGFLEIVYLTTFGEQGINHLKSLLS